jgi:hypothetical protein
MPFDYSAGSWSGDVELNTNDLFTLGGSSGYDLFSVMLHEAGHALSLDGSSDPSSPMYDSFDGLRTSLTSGDVAAIQALYGARAPDKYVAASPNDSLARATSLNLSNNGNGLNPFVVDANLATFADVDFYSFKPGNNQTSLTIMVQTSGISLVTPALTVYSPSQAIMTTLVAPDPLHGDLSVHLSNLTVGAVYYVEVSGGTGDVFSAGSYRLQIVPDGVTPVPPT